MLRKEALSFYRAISVVRLCRELEGPKGPEGSERKHGLPAEPLPVSDHVLSSKNLKDLKAPKMCSKSWDDTVLGGVYGLLESHDVSSHLPRWREVVVFAD